MGASQSLNGQDLPEPLKRECEKFVDGLIEAYIEKYSDCPPFDPRRIAEEWFNIKVEEKNKDITRSGCALTFEGERFIIVNDESFYRRKFTIAHELAHLLFHNKILTIEDVDIEQLCDYFAFNLLMPAKHFEIFARDIIESDFSFETLEKIKDHFQVSLESMILRLNGLKLIENPHRFILIFKENINKFTECDKKLRVYRRVLPKKSDFYIPENIGGDTLGLPAEELAKLGNLESLPPTEGNVISPMKDARTGKYKKQVVTCNATYKCYGHTEHKSIVGLFEIVRS